MSFLNQLKSKKNSLKSVETKVITESGLIFKEIKLADGFKKQCLLNEQTYGFIVDSNPDLNAGHVFEFLYFGSQDIACDPNILNTLQITDILSIGVTVPKYNNFMYKFIEAYDLPSFNMNSIFDECFLYIENIRLQSRRIFIHCNAGISRSPTIVIAYVMKHLKVDFEHAFKLVKETRLTINPNAGFLSQLKDYDNYLKNNLYL
ncbi:dual specificity protein phosphatase 19 [Rhopalosiphum padi]|uniref:dual specificity protein phosphatase 19 n=1 Tax=Rhopalosiphum padi TaxID=40932 RepID=UPI00298D8FE9|nr:dual specificity protein phosphatase 19 [Rhopalosiphum padi]